MRKRLHLSLWMLTAIADVGSLVTANAWATGAQNSKALALLGYVSNGSGSRLFLLATFDERYPANDFLSVTGGDSTCGWRCLADGAAIAPFLSAIRTNPSVSSASITVDTDQITCQILVSDSACSVPSTFQMTWNDNGQFIAHGTGTDTNGYPSGPVTTSHSVAIIRSADCTGQVDGDPNTWQGSGSIQYEKYAQH